MKGSLLKSLYFSFYKKRRKKHYSEHTECTEKPESSRKCLHFVTQLSLPAILSQLLLILCHQSTRRPPHRDTFFLEIKKTKNLTAERNFSRRQVFVWHLLLQKPCKTKKEKKGKKKTWTFETRGISWKATLPPFFPWEHEHAYCGGLSVRAEGKMEIFILWSFRPFRLNAFPVPPVIDSADSLSVPRQIEGGGLAAGRHNCYKQRQNSDRAHKYFTTESAYTRLFICSYTTISCLHESLRPEKPCVCLIDDVVLWW